MNVPLPDMRGVISDEGTSDGDYLVPANNTSTAEEDEEVPGVGFCGSSPFTAAIASVAAVVVVDTALSSLPPFNLMTLS